MVKLKKYKLGELIDVRRGASLAGEFYATEGELVRLTLGHFDYQDGGFKDNTSKDNLYFTGPIKPEFILNKGDIITPLTEQTPGLLGSTAMIPESGKYIQSQDVALITPDETKLDRNFCYYLLPSKIVKQQLAAGAQQTKIRHTTPDRIKDLTVFIPDLSNQKAIGQLLRDIDRKIALNREINRNLEAMARQLYNYWFIQFDFPDENGRPYKSSGGKMIWNEKLKHEIPYGWEVAAIGDILDKYPTTKRFDTSEYLNEGLHPIIDQGDSYIVGFTNETVNVLHKYPAVLFGDHSTRVKFIDFPFGRGADGTQILYSKSSKISQWYLYLFVSSLSIPNPGYSRHFKYLKEMLIIVPSQAVTDEFSKVIEPVFTEWTSQIFEVIQLSKQRDELLPLLMNGQVSVMQPEVNCDLSHD